MIRTNVTRDTDLLARIGEAAETLPDAIHQWTHREVRPYVSQQVQRRFRQEPGAVHYPIEWTSEKQRMAFFATDGFGHGIPYRRTGELVKDWHVRADYRNGLTSIAVYNDAPAAEYVYGNEQGQHQQQFHRNTGWPRFVDEIQAIMLNTDQFIEDGLGSVWTQAMAGKAARK